MKPTYILSGCLIFFTLQAFSKPVAPNESLVVVGDNSTIFTSQDGVKWLSQASPIAGLDIQTIVHAQNQYVALGSDYSPENTYSLISEDGVNWQAYLLPSPYSPNESILWANNQYIAIQNAIEPQPGGIYTSQDAIHWQHVYQQSAPYFGLQSVAFGNGKYVATGSYSAKNFLCIGYTMTSQDSINWSTPTQIKGTCTERIVWSHDQFMMVGYRSTGKHKTQVGIYISPDGNKWVWHPVTENPSKNGYINEYLNSVAWANNQYVVVGYRFDENENIFGIIFTSPDAVHWTQQKFPLASTYALGTMKWVKNQYIALGVSARNNVNNIILTSPDGITWTPQDSSSIPSLLFAISE